MIKNLEKTQRPQIVFETTGQTRKVKQDEYYLDGRGSMIRHHYDYTTIYDHEVWRKVSEDE